jgi:diacylglycerol kinase family enzyme
MMSILITRAPPDGTVIDLALDNTIRDLGMEMYDGSILMRDIDTSFTRGQIYLSGRGYMAGKSDRRILKIEMPRALAGRKRRGLRRLCDLLKQGGCEILEMESPAELNRARKGDIVLVAGGDGTLGRVFNGLKGNEASIAVFPAGLFNTFCRTHDLPCTPDGLYKAIASGEEGPVAVGVMGERVIISNASIGYKARVAKELRRRGGARKSLFSYLAPLVRCWVDLNPQHLRLRHDNGHEETVDSPLVCVAPFMDGKRALLIVYIVEKTGRLAFPLLALAVFLALPLRREINLPGLSCLKESRLEIEGEVDAVNLDGEVRCAGDIRIEAGVGDKEVVGINPTGLTRHRLLLRYGSKRRG